MIFQNLTYYDAITKNRFSLNQRDVNPTNIGTLSTLYKRYIKVKHYEKSIDWFTCLRNNIGIC
jgi:hypothetical protein